MRLSQVLFGLLLAATLAPPLAAEEAGAPQVITPQAITPLALPVTPAPIAVTPLPELPAAASEAGGGRLLITLENDLFGAGTDRNYSNGVRFAWLGEAEEVPAWLNSLARWLPLVDEGRSTRLLLEVGQSIFTPETLDDVRPPPGERPYAGWLYLGLSALLEDEEQISRLGLLAGVMGPLAGAGTVQDTVHSWLGMERPDGWDSQPDSRPGFVLLLDRFWKLVKAEPEQAIQFELLPHAGLAGGNVFTHASGGVLIRLGSDLAREPLPAAIAPGLAPGAAALADDGGFRWSFFINLQGRAVGHNTLVSGLDGEGPDANLLVGDATAGLTLSYGGISVTYARTLRTPEAAGQKTPDSFGGITISVGF